MACRVFRAARLTLWPLWLCTCVPAVASPDWIVTGRQAVVATDSALASNTGLDVLKSGGNAVDAAVAVSFALAVARPYSTGLGGGGAFTIVRFRNGDVVVQDARETAPAAARADMYAAGPNQHVMVVSHPSRHGALAIAVPGLLAGRHELWRRYGSVPFEQLAAPAAHLADEGFRLDKHYVDNANDTLAFFEAHQTLKMPCAYVYRQHLRRGSEIDPGDTLRQPALAKLLRAVGEGGADAFYHGPIADAIISKVQKLGVVDNEDDLFAAMEALRPHHQWSPDRIYFDRDPLPEVSQALIRRGHKISQTHKTGIIQAIIRDRAGWNAANDPLKGGRPAGY